jgi:putative tricarboxylic transport membrane protein
LATAAIGSFVAGTIATVFVTLFAPLVANYAVKLGPPEYFCLMLLALTTVSAVLGQSTLRGLTSLFIGLAAGLVGMDQITGQARYTGGVPELLDGVEIVLVAVGLFAVGEALYLAWQGRETKTGEVMKLSGSLWMSKQDWARSWKPWFRGAFFGFPIGAMPAGGAELPTLLSYYTEKKLSKHPEEFGHGAIEGVAGPEAANNAAAAGVLMPLLTLGIPTSATAAIMLSAFEGYGIQTGPQLFSQQGSLVWTLIASLYIGNVILLVLNLPLVSLWVKLLKIPPPWLYAGIIVISTAGVYGAGNSVFNVGLLFVFGLLGYIMRRFDFPAAPLIVGLILAPLGEQSMRQALTISQGEWSTFFTRPLSGGLMAVAALLLIVPPLWKQWRSRSVR